jgi:hypothetical protein
VIVQEHSRPEGQVVNLTQRDTLTLSTVEPTATATITFQPWEQPLLVHKAEWERVSELASRNEEILRRLDRPWWRRWKGPTK